MIMTPRRSSPLSIGTPRTVRILPQNSSCTERILWISQDIGNVDRSAFKRGAGGTRYAGRGELDFALQIP